MTERKKERIKEREGVGGAALVATYWKLAATLSNTLVSYPHTDPPFVFEEGKQETGKSQKRL